MSYVSMLASDRRSIAYRPELNMWTGGVLQTIFFQQCVWRWHHAGKKPFYKFNSSCQHKLYRLGDSWEEELGFTRRELDGARSIAYKTTYTQHEADLAQALIVYWTEVNRITYYHVNEPAVNLLLEAVYNPGPASFVALRNAQIVHYVMPDPIITLMHDLGIMNTERSTDDHIDPSTEGAGTASSSPGVPGPAVGDGDGQPKGTGKKRPSLHQQLLAAYRLALKYPIENYGAEGKAAKELLAAGYSVDQIMACYAHLKAQPFWQDKHLGLASVKKQIGAFVQAQQPATAVEMPAVGVSMLNEQLNAHLGGFEDV